MDNIRHTPGWNECPVCDLTWSGDIVEPCPKCELLIASTFWKQWKGISEQLMEERDEARRIAKVLYKYCRRKFGLEAKEYIAIPWCKCAECEAKRELPWL